MKDWVPIHRATTSCLYKAVVESHTDAFSLRERAANDDNEDSSRRKVLEVGYQVLPVR